MAGRYFGKMRNPIVLLVNGKWEMGNGKWKIENGKWKMGNGKWEI